jgi:ubiquitin-protein ligase
MTTPNEGRSLRLKNDYREMCNIRGAVLSWKAISGQPPFVETYEIEVQVRTIVSPGPSYRSAHKLRVDMPAEYPKKPPVVTMLTAPPPFHPNWYSSGRWCPGPTPLSEGLGEHIVRMVRTLQFDAEITNPNSAANQEAKDWYIRNLNRGMFPTDNKTLRDPTTSRMADNSGSRKKFRIQS